MNVFQFNKRRSRSLFFWVATVVPVVNTVALPVRV
jgi:hypothetical protein